MGETLKPIVQAAHGQQNLNFQVLYHTDFFYGFYFSKKHRLVLRHTFR